MVHTPNFSQVGPPLSGHADEEIGHWETRVLHLAAAMWAMADVHGRDLATYLMNLFAQMSSKEYNATIEWPRALRDAVVELRTANKEGWDNFGTLGR